ncbi:uncharacterized protein LOC141852362 [Brevipalpus obovatus]|uniref:uncharacterized protein LOC141852362 n=1 Tax=Brevipalpus obovatus TaxID=246614 RepID=UPI003D9EB463
MMIRKTFDLIPLCVILSFTLVSSEMKTVTPTVDFLEACKAKIGPYPATIQRGLEKSILKARLFTYHKDFSANEELFMKIFRHRRFCGEGVVIVGYRGNLVVMSEWQVLDHEISSHPRCRLCNTRVSCPTLWIQHVNSNACVILNPVPWFPALNTLPLLNNLDSEGYCATFPHL